MMSLSHSMNIFINGKTISFLIMIFSASLLMISKSWFFVWLLLEINTLSFIFYSYQMSNASLNSCLKYFIMQAIPSSFFLFLFSYNEMFHIFSTVNYFLPLIFSLKMGLFPFHLWLMSMSETFSWNSFVSFNTVQKITPLWVLSSLVMKYSFVSNFIIISSSILGCWLMFNQTSIKKMLAMSSLIHMSWIIFMICSQSNTWTTYFFIYFYCTILLLFLPKNMFSLMQFFFLKKMNKFIFLFIMMNFCSLPPLIMFFSKIKALILLQNNITTIFTLSALIISSLISCYTYFLFIMPTIFNSIYQLKMQKNPTWWPLHILIISSLLCFILTYI